MIHISEIMEAGALGLRLNEGYVSRRKHPSKPLEVLNYTDKAQYDNLWDEVTSQCRGLVVDSDGYVVARPFRKFHNWNPDDTALAPMLDAQTVAWDKLDGSLGVVFYYDGEWDVCTRGSFESEQAIWARANLDKCGAPQGWLEPTLTHLCEIVYPGNRIVCDYGDKEALILLATVETETGKLITPDGSSGGGLCWCDETASLIHEGTLREILELEPRPGAEGLVLHVEGHGMWKLKQEDYVRLHRIVFGLTERAVWEHMGANDYLVTDDFMTTLPEEFHDWVAEVTARLTQQLEHKQRLAGIEFNRIRYLADDRKAFALEAVKWATPSLLFLLLDGKDIRPSIWKELYPEHRPARLLSEEAA